MKKIIFILALFLSCYLIYKYTINDKIDYLVIGDSLSKGNNEYNVSGYGYSDFVKDYLIKENKLASYNKSFTNKDYRIFDIYNILNYNESKLVDGEDTSLNQLLEKADLITLSIGMNELYYKLVLNNDNIYSYVDEMICDMDKVFELIRRINKKDVYVLGYYNLFSTKQDIFNYLNYKLKKLTDVYKFNYVDMSFMNNNSVFFNDFTNFNPNLLGYQQISKKIIEKIKNN